MACTLKDGKISRVETEATPLPKSARGSVRRGSAPRQAGMSARVMVRVRAGITIVWRGPLSKWTAGRMGSPLMLDRCKLLHGFGRTFDICFVRGVSGVAAKGGKIIEVGDHREIMVVGPAADIVAAEQRSDLWHGLGKGLDR